MNWRSSRLLILLLSFCIVLLAVLFFSLHFMSDANQLHNPKPSTTSRVVPPLPTPGSARTIYTNTMFNYSIKYPTQWYFTTTSNMSLVRVLMRHSPSVPEATAFEITCFNNPNQLDAQILWQQSQPPDNSERAIGPVTLSSGASAYVANGQGQTPYTVYTLANKQRACQIVTMQTDPANAPIVLAVVNSFRWS